jgi:hypothetical protein
MQRKYRKFDFGFLNVAQDEDSGSPSEAIDITNVDPDGLPLGTLRQTSERLETVSAVKQWDSTTLGAASFALANTLTGSLGYTYDADVILPLLRYPPNVNDSSIYSPIGPTLSLILFSPATFVAEDILGSLPSSETDPLLWTDSDFSLRCTVGGNLELITKNAQTALLETLSVPLSAGENRIEIFAVRWTLGNLDIYLVCNGTQDSYSYTVASYTEDYANNVTYFENTFSLAFLALSESRMGSDWSPDAAGNQSDKLIFNFRARDGLLYANDEGFGIPSSAAPSLVGTGDSLLGQLTLSSEPDEVAARVSLSYFNVFNTSKVTAGSEYVPDLLITTGVSLAVMIELESSGFHLTSEDLGIVGLYDSALTAVEAFVIGGDITNGLYVSVNGTIGTTKISIQDNPSGNIVTRSKIVLLYGYSDSLYFVSIYLNNTLLSTLTSASPFAAQSLTDKYIYFTPQAGFTGVGQTDVLVYNFFIGEPLPSFNPEGWTTSDPDEYLSSIYFATINGSLTTNSAGADILSGITGVTHGFVAEYYLGELLLQPPTLPINRGVFPATPPIPTTGFIDLVQSSADSALITDQAVSTAGYVGPESLYLDYRIRISKLATTATSFQIFTKPTTSGNWSYLQATAVNVASSAAAFDFDIAVGYGLRVAGSVPSGYIVGDTFDSSLIIQAPTLIDGDYQYKLVPVIERVTDKVYELRGKPTAPLLVTLRNLDEAGDRLGNKIPQISLPGVTAPATRYDVYRKDPDAEQYVKVHSYTDTNVITFNDSISLLSLGSVVILAEALDEDFDTIDEAIGNTSGSFDKLFSKDNRLWLVPTDRKDLLLYSRDGDWWGWRRENSFSVTGDITDIAIQRDPTVLSGESTLIIGTTKGLYHLLGAGTEQSPYTLVSMFGGGDSRSELAIEPNSFTPAKGALFLMTKAGDGSYDAGPYGNKVYQYDLSQLVEVSKRISDTSGSWLLQSNAALDRAELIGGDKLAYRRLGTELSLVYHMDARGWLKFETDGGVVTPWRWESRVFHRMSGVTGSPADAKAIRIEYIGRITLTFSLRGANGSSVREVSVTLPVAAQKRRFENLLPSMGGSAWSFSVEAGDASTQLFGLWFA